MIETCLKCTSDHLALTFKIWFTTRFFKSIA
nr:MAG TPA: hypothetical protein [Caudoviricetes sp.]